MKHALALGLVLALVPACQSVRGAVGVGNEENAVAQMEFLKGLAGTWTGTSTSNGKTTTVTSRWDVTAGGTTVVETLFPGEPHEMVTVFHRDGARVLATHFCSIGNQPRLRAVDSDPAAGGSGQSIQFTFFDATNLRSTDDLHMGGLLVTRKGDTLSERWTAFSNGRIDHETKFTFSKSK